MSEINKKYDDETDIVNSIEFTKTIDEKTDSIKCEIVKTESVVDSVTHIKYSIDLSANDMVLNLTSDEIKKVNSVMSVALNSIQQYENLNEKATANKVVDW